MKQALCVVGNQATPVTGEVCGDNETESVCTPTAPAPAQVLLASSWTVGAV